MDFDHVGVHCALADCKQRDFLPFRCQACDQQYCLEHRTLEAHRCPRAPDVDRTAIICPVCKHAVQVKPSEDPNTKVVEHIDSGCKTGVTKVASSARNPCAFPGCKQSELIPIVCKKCRKNFCLRHRFESDHKCGQKQAPPARPHPPQLTVPKQTPALKAAPIAKPANSTARATAPAPAPVPLPAEQAQEEMWCVLQ